MRGIGHVNDLIKQFMTPYYKKFGNKINIASILEAGGIRRSDLPRLTRYVNANNTNLLCYNCIMGECGFGNRCTYVKGHAKKHAVPNDFAEHLIRVVKNGVEYLVNYGGTNQRGQGANHGHGGGGYQPDATQSGWGGGHYQPDPARSGGKRPRR